MKATVPSTLLLTALCAVVCPIGAANLDIKKVILDVDAGADDAVAILSALGLEDTKVLAITTVAGNTNRDQVNINVLRTLKSVNVTIPVYSGSPGALLITPSEDSFYGKDGFGDVPDPNPPNMSLIEKEHAVLKMIELVNLYPDEITIIVLGPLTNIATAMRLDPTFSSKVKNIAWTGGSVKGIGNIRPGIEFNAYFDCAANFIVFNSTAKPIVMVNWELIITAIIPVTWRREVLGKINSPQIHFLNQIEEYSMRFGEWEVADGKTMAVALMPELVKKAELLHVEAITEGEFTKGALLVDYNHNFGRAPNALIIQEIDIKGLENMFLKTLSVKLPLSHQQVGEADETV